MPIDDNDLTFRPHRFGFFLSLAVMLGVGLASLLLSVTQHPAWFAGAAFILYLGGARVSRYTAGSLALRGYDLVLYLGTLIAREVASPIWETRIEIRQTLIGRMLDPSTVIVQKVLTPPKASGPSQRLTNNSSSACCGSCGS